MNNKLTVPVCRGNELANALFVYIYIYIYVFQARCGLRFTIIHHNYNPFHENCDAAFILDKMLLQFFSECSYTAIHREICGFVARRSLKIVKIIALQLKLVRLSLLCAANVRAIFLL